MYIKTAEQQASVQRAGGYRRWVEQLVVSRWGRNVVNWQTVGVVAAEIYRSDWVARCPFCAGAQVIEPGEPFFCVDCVMQANDFKAMAIILPDESRDIIAVLIERPDPNTRNWLIGETVEQLLAENIEHGVR